MWKQILDFIFYLIQLLSELGTWLFTPININVVPESFTQFTKEMRQSGLSNFPTWILDFFSETATPIYVTPIQVFSVGTITAIFVWALVKTIWSN